LGDCGLLMSSSVASSAAWFCMGMAALKRSTASRSEAPTRWNSSATWCRLCAAAEAASASTASARDILGWRIEEEGGCG